MEKKRNIWLFLIVLLILMTAFSCRDKDEEEEIPTEPIIGKIELPEGAQMSASELKVVSMVDEKKSNNQGTFISSIYQTERPQVVLCQNQAGKTVLLGYTGADAEINLRDFNSMARNGPAKIVSVRKTACALIMTSPWLFFTSSQIKSDVLFLSQSLPEFQELIDLIENVFIEDPENLLNQEAHPEVYQKALTVSLKAIQLYKESTPIQHKIRLTPRKSGPPWIEKGQEANEIVFINQYFVDYATEIHQKPDFNYLDTLTLKGVRHFLLDIDLSWPPSINTYKPTETTYQLADGQYQVYVTRGFNLNLDLLDLDSATHKATVANFCRITLVALDLWLGFIPDLPYTNFSFDPKSKAYFAKIFIDMTNTDAVNLMRHMVGLLNVNKEEIVFWVQAEWGREIKETFIETALDNFAGIVSQTNVVLKGFDLVDNKIPFFYDLATAPGDITYHLTKGEEEISLNNPPTIKITSPEDGSSFAVGQDIHFTADAHDVEDGQLAHSGIMWYSDIDDFFCWGEDFYENSLSIGNHIITAFARDSEEAEASDQINITITENQPPQVKILSPPDNASFTQGQLIAFKGQAEDPEEGLIESDKLNWESDLDGYLGSGTSLEESALSIGDHIIILKTFDNQGTEGQASITIHIKESQAEDMSNDTVIEGYLERGQSRKFSINIPNEAVFVWASANASYPERLELYMKIDQPVSKTDFDIATKDSSSKKWGKWYVDDNQPPKEIALSDKTSIPIQGGAYNFLIYAKNSTDFVFKVKYTTDSIDGLRVTCEPNPVAYEECGLSHDYCWLHRYTLEETNGLPLRIRRFLSVNPTRAVISCNGSFRLDHFFDFEDLDIYDEVGGCCYLGPGDVLTSNRLQYSKEHLFVGKELREVTIIAEDAEGDVVSDTVIVELLGN